MRVVKFLMGTTVLAMVAGLGLQAADPVRPADADRETETVTTEGAAPARTVAKARHYRLSSLTGMQVRNPNGEELGEIEDYVIDMQSGRISYVALSFGGFLGLGDKLFAIPFKAMSLQRDADDNDYFVLAVPKEKLEKAPGFDQDHWPNVADPKWSQEIDHYYRDHTPNKVSQRADRKQR
ncbi:MAG: PRC-barrel domain-containing protein [Pirellulales bacterium]